MSKKVLAVLAVLLGLGMLGSLGLFAREQAARAELSAQVESLSADLAAREEAIEVLTADAGRGAGGGDQIPDHRGRR